MLGFVESITKDLDEVGSVDLIYLDFAKAFDKVPHKRLLKKVVAHGITGNISYWIDKWLSNRRQRVVIEDNYSGWCNVSTGVPQGSVLGPTLFILYINNINEGIVSKINKFADDCKLSKSMHSQEDVKVLRKDL